MAMQIHGNQDFPGTDYEERVKQGQTAGKADRTKETENAADVKGSDKQTGPRDEYISSEKSGKKPTGLYRVGQDENGNRKIFFEDPKKGKPESCVSNTDAVDREIRKLKEERQELEQRIRSASGDEKKVRELEKKLAQVEQELSQKDNDAYRRQHTVFSQTK